MNDNTILWRRGNGMYTRHTTRLPDQSGNAYKGCVTRYAREVFNAFPEVVAIDICDGVSSARNPACIAQVRREDVQPMVRAVSYA